MSPIENPPEQIGSYRIDRALGTGGMGEVYLGFDESLERPVAIKLVRAETASGGRTGTAAGRRFRSEARAAARLAHPNIVQIYHILEADEGDAIVMEYVEGETLAERLQHGPLGLAEAVDIGRQVALGLAEAHGKGLVHRDLKAANVMVAKGRVKILDFGLAKTFELASGMPGGTWQRDDDAASVLETPPDVVLGSFDAMSPEQAQGKPVGPASDLFSLGLLLYALLTGRKPFWAETVLASLTRLCTEPHAPIRPQVPATPQSLLRLIDRLLEKRPRDRPADAAWVSRALGSIAEELRELEAGSDSSSGAGLPAPSPTPSTLRAVLVAELPSRESLWDELSERAAARLLTEQDGLMNQLEDEYQGIRADELERQWVLFELPLAAVRFALDYHRELDRLASEAGVELGARVAVHFGEIVLRRVSGGRIDPDVVPFEVRGPAKAVALGLLELGQVGQTLISRRAFDLARNALWDDSSSARGLRWMAHGDYRLPRVENPVGVYEVGIEGRSPLRPPDSPGATPIVGAGQAETILGWRPAIGQKVPGRANWLLESKLGEGGFGEVWLARHGKMNEARVFKFCFESNRLRALQREITLFRLLEGELGGRPDIARIIDWNFEQAPYFIESEHVDGGNLRDWLRARGGDEPVPLGIRLEIIAQVADALAAAHSVGVLHKDVKPGNVLIARDAEGRPQARLADFGIGMVTDRQRLAAAGITVLGLTQNDDASSSASHQGTWLYQAPELMAGKAATVQADIFALGVMLYQAVVGDFSRALGPGWERDVEDELLREDIALAVDVSPERRLDHAAGLAERLRSLEVRRWRRRKREARRHEAERVRLELDLARARRKIFLFALVVLVIFGSVMTWQANRIAREVERANREAETASQVSAFLTDLLLGSDPWNEPGATEPTVGELLARGAEKVRSELETEPLVRARLMHTIGTIYAELAAYEEARPLLEEALELRTRLLGPEHVDTAITLSAVGLIETYGADPSLAVEYLERANEILERELGPHAPELIDGLERLALIYNNAGDVEASSALARRGLEILEKSDDPDLAMRGRLLLSVGNGYESTGELEKAEAAMREAIRVTREAYGAEHFFLAEAYADLAHLLVRTDQLEEARPLLERSRTLLTARVGAEHPFVAATWRVEGDLLLRLEQWQAAGRAYETARAIVRASQLGDVPGLEVGLDHGLALAYWGQGELEKAAASFAAMEERMFAAPSIRDWRVLAMFGNYLRFLEETARPADVESARQRLSILLARQKAEEKPGEPPARADGAPG